MKIPMPAVNSQMSAPKMPPIGGKTGAMMNDFASAAQSNKNQVKLFKKSAKAKVKMAKKGAV